jgi:hypothetical protein
MFVIKSLQQRLIIFMILPVAVFLAAIGVGGYFYMRGSLYQEWQDSAILRLERAAHYMDRRLGEPLQWVQSLANTGGDRRGTDNQNWVLKKLREQPGVSQVTLEWRKPEGGGPGTVQEGRGGLAPRVAKVSAPQFSYPPDHRTVSLTFNLLDESGYPLGHLDVSIKLNYLMEGVRTAGWLHTYMACLVNDNGTFLAHTNPAMAGRRCLGETENPLELVILQEMQTKPYGTAVGRKEVTGYYRLSRAPWAIMLHAQESQIMAPILRFRFDYIMAGLLCLSVSLILMQLGVGSMVAAILRIS